MSPAPELRGIVTMLDPKLWDPKASAKETQPLLFYFFTPALCPPNYEEDQVALRVPGRGAKACSQPTASASCQPHEVETPADAMWSYSRPDLPGLQVPKQGRQFCCCTVLDWGGSLRAHRQFMHWLCRLQLGLDPFEFSLGMRG